ncbi:MAG: hypothetical protein ACE5FH_06355, partial [Candidatus Zixiibacteriota bacterium]
MEVLISIIGAVSTIAGMVLRRMALRYRTELGMTIRWYHVKYWFMPWAITDLLTPKGIRCHVTSVALIMAGLALY